MKVSRPQSGALPSGGKKKRVAIHYRKKIDLFLSKIPYAEKKIAFLEEFRSTKTRKNLKKLLEKYKVVLSEEDVKELHENTPQQLSAEDL